MSLDIAAGASAPAPLPIQFLDIKLSPLHGGQFSLQMQATLLDEEALEFIAEELASEQVATLDQALAVIRQNLAALAPSCGA
jgi:hypothetical protein